METWRSPALKYRSEKIENWCSDFCLSDDFRNLGLADFQGAHDLLRRFLGLCCKARDIEPEEIGEADVSAAVKALPGEVAMDEAQGRMLKACIAGLFEFLQAQGRLGGGEALGFFVRACQFAAKGRTEKSQASPLGRNDPCPCGSGRKYKKCCAGMLGG